MGHVDVWRSGDLDGAVADITVLRVSRSVYRVESAEVVSTEQVVTHVGCRHVPARVDTCLVRAVLVWDTSQARVRWHTPHTRWHACNTRDTER